jgi:hypothetical protein
MQVAIIGAGPAAAVEGVGAHSPSAYGRPG